jgi:hypothetical protein
MGHLMNTHPTAQQLVARRIQDGWRPAKTRERLWIKPTETQGTGPDRDIEETWDESEPMSDAEEQALLDWQWQEDATVGGALEPLVVDEPPEPDTESTTGAPNDG